MATHSSILAGRVPWTEEPDGLQTVHRVARVRHDLATEERESEIPKEHLLLLLFLKVLSVT